MQYWFWIIGFVWMIFAVWQQSKRDCETSFAEYLFCAIMNFLGWFICIPVAIWNYVVRK